ncbi:hypothetical protein WA158_002256 [Blastocystis sp. Blastoise]
MCHQTTCQKCNKPTWSGCGNHVESALGGIPEDQRCHCKPWTQSLADSNPDCKGKIIDEIDSETSYDESDIQHDIQDSYTEDNQKLFANILFERCFTNCSKMNKYCEYMYHMIGNCNSLFDVCMEVISKCMIILYDFIYVSLACWYQVFDALNDVLISLTHFKTIDASFDITYSNVPYLIASFLSKQGSDEVEFERIKLSFQIISYLFQIDSLNPDYFDILSDMMSPIVMSYYLPYLDDHCGNNLCFEDILIYANTFLYPLIANDNPYTFYSQQIYSTLYQYLQENKSYIYQSYIYHLNDITSLYEDEITSGDNHNIYIHNLMEDSDSSLYTPSSSFSSSSVISNNKQDSVASEITPITSIPVSQPSKPIAITNNIHIHVEDTDDGRDLMCTENKNDNKGNMKISNSNDINNSDENDNHKDTDNDNNHKNTDNNDNNNSDNNNDNNNSDNNNNKVNDNNLATKEIKTHADNSIGNSSSSKKEINNEIHFSCSDIPMENINVNYFEGGDRMSVNEEEKNINRSVKRDEITMEKESKDNIKSILLLSSSDIDDSNEDITYNKGKENNIDISYNNTIQGIEGNVFPDLTDDEEFIKIVIRYYEDIYTAEDYMRTHDNFKYLILTPLSIWNQLCMFITRFKKGSKDIQETSTTFICILHTIDAYNNQEIVTSVSHTNNQLVAQIAALLSILYKCIPPSIINSNKQLLSIKHTLESTSVDIDTDINKINTNKYSQTENENTINHDNPIKNSTSDIQNSETTEICPKKKILQNRGNPTPKETHAAHSLWDTIHSDPLPQTESTPSSISKQYDMNLYIWCISNCPYISTSSIDIILTELHEETQSFIKLKLKELNNQEKNKRLSFLKILFPSFPSFILQRCLSQSPLSMDKFSYLQNKTNFAYPWKYEEIEEIEQYIQDCKDIFNVYILCILSKLCIYRYEYIYEFW